MNVPRSVTITSQEMEVSLTIDDDPEKSVRWNDVLSAVRDALLGLGYRFSSDVYEKFEDLIDE